MSHLTRVQGRTVRKAVQHGSESPTPGIHMEWVGEWVVICDKCGLIDKAGTPADAEARAARHKEMPNR
jgi:hypothetical protein